MRYCNSEGIWEVSKSRFSSSFIHWLYKLFNILLLKTMDSKQKINNVVNWENVLRQLTLKYISTSFSFPFGSRQRRDLNRALNNLSSHCSWRCFPHSTSNYYNLAWRNKATNSTIRSSLHISFSSINRKVLKLSEAALKSCSNYKNYIKLL